MRVFILLYNPRTDHEGIHTIRVADEDIVLMFESEDDATRFALMLEAQDFPVPTIEPIDMDEVTEIGQEAGYRTQLIPEGSLIVPPEQNLDIPNWDQAQTETNDNSIDRNELEEFRRRLEKLL